MRILLINNLLPPNIVGGAEISVNELASSLKKIGVEVFTLSIGKDNNIHANASKIFFDYHNFENSWPLNKQRSFFQRLSFQFRNELLYSLNFKFFDDILDKIQPDIVHTNNLAGLTSVIWKACHNHKIKTVHTLRDYNLVCIKQSFYNNNKVCDINKRCKSCKLGTLTKSINSQYVSHVVGNSQRTLDIHLSQGYFKNSTKSVISGGLNSVSKQKNEHVYNSKCLKIGFLGQITKDKGIEVFCNLADRFNNHCFYVGGDTQSKYAGNFVENNTRSNLKFCGRVVPSDFFKTIDLLIVPSLWEEPLPRVIYESYSFGVPVLAHNIGGNPDVIINRYHLYNNFNELCNMIDDISNSKLFGAFYDYKKHSSRFLADNVSSKYFSLYNKLLKIS